MTVEFAKYPALKRERKLELILKEGNKMVRMKLVIVVSSRQTYLLIFGHTYSHEFIRIRNDRAYKPHA